MKTRFLAIGLAALPLISPQAKTDLTIAANEVAGEIEVRFKSQTLLVYAFKTNQFKPYVRELYTLRGENVLRDAPADHLHHHGLMYAITVNGVNFWEEQKDPGVQKPIKLLSHNTSTAKGLPQASFTQLIHWVARTNREAANAADTALLIERRTLTLTVNEPAQEVELVWVSDFEVGKAAARVTLHGTHYHGLGLRLPESFNHVAKFQNSHRMPYNGGKNTQTVNPAQWTSVSGVMDGREVMLVMFGRQDNGRGDSLFFTMLDPFAYLSATQGLDQMPMQYAADRKFTLSFLLTGYTENKSLEFIEQRCERWIKERR
jgi:hypothetical protein